MASFGDDEFLDFNFDPRGGEVLEGGRGEIGGKGFDQFALFGLSGFSEELAEVEVVEGVLDVVGLSGFFQIGDGNSDGAEEFLGVGSLLFRNTDVTEEFKVDQGESRSHEGLGRRMIE